MRRSSALFGLIDDVDCAVISMEITKDVACPVHLQHVASIPALAYVATGVLGAVRCARSSQVCSVQSGVLGPVRCARSSQVSVAVGSVCLSVIVAAQRDGA